jgi:ATP-binding cassette subfamily C (CFTR/MRP) protein 1
MSEVALPPLPQSNSVHADFDRLNREILRYRNLGHLAICRAILSSYSLVFIKVVALSLVVLAAGLSSPLLLREILKGLSADFIPPDWYSTAQTMLPEQLRWISYSLLASLALTGASVINILSIHHLFYLQPNLAFQVRSALNAIIFAKALRQQRASQQQVTTGFIVNLIGSDTQKIQILLGFLHSVWTHPLYLLCIIYILYQLVGLPALIGGSSLIILLVTSITITRKQGKLRSQLSAIADRRIGLTRESLMHIKAAKLQGWESNLEQKIQTLRGSEVQLSRRLIRLSAVFSFCSGSAPAIAMAITSVCLVYRGEPLEAATLFPVLTLFMQLRFSLNILPDTIYNLMEANVSSRRIFSVLTSPEFTPPPVNTGQESAISLTAVMSRWSEGGNPATDVAQLEIPRGQLVVVVGMVGSGKSGLLLTILGELPAEQGSVSLGGSVAYVPQTPWIISDSIRNNILFGSAFNNEIYGRSIHCANLNVDLSMLPHADHTEIGERGINLSGGQRQRVALARAVYRDADIYLFDDPLSALDPQVANHVFTNLICNELQSKTRVLVSHRVEFGVGADRVLVMENGLIVEDGPPSDLRLRDSRFAALLKAHQSTTSDETQSVSPTIQTSVELESVEELSPMGDLAHNAIIETEERRSGSVLATTVRAYASKLAPGSIIVFMALLFLGRQGAAVGTDLWLTNWADQLQVDMPLFLGGYLLCIGLLCLIGYLRTMYILSRGLCAGADCHRGLLRGVLRAPLTFFESNPVGRILNRFSRDLETVELTLPRAILDAGQCLIETAVVALVIAVVTPVTLLLVAPVAILYYGLSVRFRPLSRELQRSISTSLSPIFALASECLSGIESLRASALGDSCNRSFANALDIHTRYNFLQTATNRWLGIRLETLGSTLICAVGVAASCGWSISVGIAFSGLALAYASVMTSSMNWAIRSTIMVENSLTSFERIERYSTIPSERRIGAKPPAGWPTDGAIEFCNLSARYRPYLPLALKEITCSIPAGSRVGVIGRTGSGKSTLILTLLRLVEPCAGHIEIDGVDLSSLTLQELRTSIAVVPQEPVLFSGTLRQSLDPFYAYSDSDIISALDRVELGPLLVSLPAGLNSEVSEGGLNFSNGQRQLICLARALLRRSKVVILDEATASIDAHTDQTIQRAIRREFTTSTLLVIAHRLGTVLDSDYIFAMQEGALIEFGAPSTLLQQPNSLLCRFVTEIQAAHG